LDAAQAAVEALEKKPEDHQGENENENDDGDREGEGKSRGRGGDEEEEDEEEDEEDDEEDDDDEDDESDDEDDDDEDDEDDEDDLAEQEAARMMERMRVRAEPSLSPLPHRASSLLTRMMERMRVHAEPFLSPLPHRAPSLLAHCLPPRGCAYAPPTPRPRPCNGLHCLANSRRTASLSCPVSPSLYFIDMGSLLPHLLTADGARTPLSRRDTLLPHMRAFDRWRRRTRSSSAPSSPWCKRASRA